jgi:predicted house-cleaning noncanonical NTP pyrophosphatase (MazG superfamily)
METSTIIKQVRDNILEALSNDYDFSSYTDEELAGDLHAYAEDLENKTFEQILQAVKTIRSEGIACQKR